MRIAIFFIAISALATGPALAERLALQDCIDTALTRHPAIRSAREGVNAGRSRVTQARSPYLPQVRASTGYSESHAAGGAFGDTITKSYQTTLSVNQMLYDFGKTGAALDAAELGTKSAQLDEDRVRQDVVLNVKQAYFGLLQAGKLVVVAEQTFAQAERHLQQAEAFFRAGSKPRFEVTRAEVEVNSARLGLINARNNVRLSTLTLSNAMGAEPVAEIEVEDVLGQPVALPSLEQAQEAALKGRPEMLQADADIQSAKARIKTEKSNYLPTISAAGAYNFANGTTEIDVPPGFPPEIGRGDVGNSWNAGVTLSLPLYEGGLTRGRVGEARANALMLESQRDALRQSILLEVNQVYADLESAAARIDVMESSLRKARESLELAEGRYKAGVGPSIEMTDAQVAAARAETDHIQALYDYQLAAARLYKAMGRAER
jgi:TolC family type I secretion outer membrane protein